MADQPVVVVAGDAGLHTLLRWTDRWAPLIAILMVVAAADLFLGGPAFLWLLPGLALLVLAGCGLALRLHRGASVTVTDDQVVVQGFRHGVLLRRDIREVRSADVGGFGGTLVVRAKQAKGHLVFLPLLWDDEARARIAAALGQPLRDRDPEPATVAEPAHESVRRRRPRPGPVSKGKRNWKIALVVLGVLILPGTCSSIFGDDEVVQEPRSAAERVGDDAGELWKAQIAPRLEDDETFPHVGYVSEVSGATGGDPVLQVAVSMAGDDGELPARETAEVVGTACGRLDDEVADQVPRSVQVTWVRDDTPDQGLGRSLQVQCDVDQELLAGWLAAAEARPVSDPQVTVHVRVDGETDALSLQASLDTVDEQVFRQVYDQVCSFRPGTGALRASVHATVGEEDEWRSASPLECSGADAAVAAWNASGS